MKTIYTILFFFVFPLIGLTQVTSSYDGVIGLDNSFSEHISNNILGPINLESEFEVYGPGTNKIGWRFGVNFNRTLFKPLHLKLGFRVANGGFKGPEMLVAQGVEKILYKRFDFYFFEMPLAIRFEFGDAKFSPFFEGGIAYNLMYGSKITEVRTTATTTTSMELRFSSLKNLNHHQISGYISAGINCHLFHFGSIFFQPIYRYHFTPFQETGNYNFHLANFGFELGLRRLFIKVD